ncbi:hypothetical protein IFM89_002627 [Coptis chinensis]|uniref:Uncharacterized protein n=1 Tax=Coptis chinensis TaxID=261450 RepID=A0A835GTS3_9MAGN|nr:hypothetical protein IFM89_002627 [Coptis chinensis]
MDFDVRGDQVLRFSHFPTWVPRLPDISTYKDVDVKVCREEMFGVVVEEKNVCDCLVDGNVERKRVNVEKKKKELLPVKRPKVKFKFGMDLALGVNNVELRMRNGVCRGGKRVSCHNLSEEEDIMSFKRRR